MNTNISTVEPVNLRTFDLREQFQRCEQWNDPDQWDALAMVYYQRGYLLNALYCFRRADALRVNSVVELETV